MPSALTLAATNLLLQEDYTDPIYNALLGSDDGGLWVFAERNYATVENTQKGMVVVNEMDASLSPNQHNTERFKRLEVDVWMDPTRNSDKSVQERDADVKIERVFERIDRHLHMAQGNCPHSTSPSWWGLPGFPFTWGTQAEIQARSGVIIDSSFRTAGPDFSDMANNDGGRMGRCIYEIALP